MYLSLYEYDGNVFKECNEFVFKDIYFYYMYWDLICKVMLIKYICSKLVNM